MKIAVLLLTTGSSLVFGLLTSKTFRHISNTRADTDVEFENVYVTDAVKCCAICIPMDGCKGAQFNKMTSHCQLLVTSDSVGSYSINGWSLYIVTNNFEGMSTSFKPSKIYEPFHKPYSAWCRCHEVVGSSPGRALPKTLKYE